MGNIFYSLRPAHAEEERRKIWNGTSVDKLNDGKECETGLEELTTGGITSTEIEDKTVQEVGHIEEKEDLCPALHTNKDDHTAPQDDTKAERLDHQMAEVSNQNEGLQADKMEVTDQKTWDGVSAAGCTKDTEHTGATDGQLCTQDEEGQGRHEVEVTFEGNKDECEKKERHSEYIPVSKFCMGDLPKECRTERMQALVNALVELTVLIRVKCTSDKRPQYCLDTEDPYPRFKGYHVGSGRVLKVIEDPNVQPEDVKSHREECQTCKTQSKKPLALIVIETNAHVVFDLTEGEKTTCVFDYNTDSTELDLCPKLIAAVSVESYTTADISRVKFVTHEMGLAERLKKASLEYWRLHGAVQCDHGLTIQYDDCKGNLFYNISVLHNEYQEMLKVCHELMDRWRNVTGNDYHQEQKRDLFKDHVSVCESNAALVSQLLDVYQSHVQKDDVKWVMDKYYENLLNLEKMYRMLRDLTDDGSDHHCSWWHYNSSYPWTVIVSHPHGREKQISIGRVITRNRNRKLDGANYTYDATTCPGSSGAPVYILGRLRRWGDHLTCPHSHHVEGEKNASAVFLDS